MPIELTDEEIDAALEDALIWLAPITDHERKVFRVGLAAGIERAAQVFEQDPKPLITPQQAAAAIRALLK